MEELLAQANNKAEMAEVFVVSSEITPVEFETNRLKSIQHKQTTTAALRIIKQGRLGYAVSTRLDDREGLVRMALETAEFGMPARFAFPPHTTYPAIDVFDPDITSLKSEQMIEIGEELLAPIIKHTHDIVCEAEVTRAHTIIQVINSESSCQTVFISHAWFMKLKPVYALFSAN